MPFIQTLVITWKKLIRLPSMQKYHPTLLPSFGKHRTHGKTNNGLQHARLLLVSRNLIPYMKYTWVRGEENTMMETAR